MDILAARKKAAERARTGKTSPAEPRPAADERLEQEVHAPAFPPLPETAFAPEEAALSPDEAPLTPARSAAAPVETAWPETSSREPEREPEQQAAPEAPDEETEEEAGEEQEAEREMLAFQLGSEEYVVPVDQVLEVLTPREITPVPHSKAFILGVCSLRGIVLPIIDLHRRLGLPEAARDEKSRILVMNLGPDDQVGLFVDRVRGVVRFLPSAVRPVPETIEQGAEFLQGIARKGDRLFILLDVGKTTEI